MIDIQNGKPDGYPILAIKQTIFGLDKRIIVDEGDFVVDINGYLLEVTSGNKKYLKYENEYLRDLNLGYIRAKYLGNRDDFLWFSNSIRMATEDEVNLVKKWLKERPEPLKIMPNGQLSFFL